MTSILDSYNALPPMLRAYWAIAVAASIVFLIQMALTFIGIGDADDAGGGMDADFSSDGSGDTLDTGGAVQLFTVRNVVNFLLGLGWGGVCFGGAVGHPFALLVVSLLCGCLFVAAFLLMLRQVMKLQHHGNFRIQQCVGMTCQVYLRIPAQRASAGKVQLSWHGSVLEIDALTDGPQLPSGSRVTVIGVTDSHTLLVSALSSQESN